MNEAIDTKEGAGRLLFSQSGVTLYLIIFSLLAGILFIAASVFVFVTFKEDTFFGWLALIVGCLVLIPFISGFLRKVECYQNGIIVRKWWKREFVAFKDICAIRYYALSKYNNGLYSGTACVIELLPLHNKTIKFEVFGTENDSRKAWELVQIIRKVNPKVDLVEY
ncbi:MAG TPA: hypothetical protein VFQ47_04045 [Nitrososphaera sp.]|jgi:hypothetical protein|nr:hypothetical protein [Nitrososphaera sp.]